MNDDSERNRLQTQNSHLSIYLLYGAKETVECVLSGLNS